MKNSRAVSPTVRYLFSKLFYFSLFFFKRESSPRFIFVFMESALAPMGHCPRTFKTFFFYQLLCASFHPSYVDALTGKRRAAENAAPDFGELIKAASFLHSP